MGGDGKNSLREREREKERARERERELCRLISVNL
jgi:hypothetical protein